MSETGAVYAATMRRLLKSPKILGWAEIARNDDLSVFRVEGQKGLPRLSPEAFVTWLLFRQEKPMNENLICKHLKEYGVTYPRNVSAIITTLCCNEVLKWSLKKGYEMRPAMRDLIKDKDLKGEPNGTH